MFDPAEAERIEAAFDAAQAKTRAPVICVLAHASVALDAEFLLGACILALLTPLPLLTLTTLSAERIYVAQLLVGLLSAVIGAIPWVRRALVPARALRSVCHQAALAQFVVRGLDRTGCGVLVYVSLAEHFVRIIPDEDAAAAVSHGEWQIVVDEALGPLAAGAIETALTTLAERCAERLAKPFPPTGVGDPLPRQRFHVL